MTAPPHNPLMRAVRKARSHVALALATSQACLLAAGIAWTATAATAAAPSQDWPQLPTPESATAYWVAPHIVHNGIPMQIQAFDAKESPARIRRLYDQWLAGKQGFGTTQRGATEVLGARIGDYHVTVELRPGDDGNGTAGRISAAAIYGAKSQVDSLGSVAPGKGFPQPVGTVVLSDTVSFDPGQRNRTLTLRNAISVETNALYLREHLLLQGWSLLSDQTIRGGLQSALVFRRKGEELLVNISTKAGHCYIVASQTTPDET